MFDKKVQAEALILDDEGSGAGAPVPAARGTVHYADDEPR
jgi:hypothetical protein